MVFIYIYHITCYYSGLLKPVFLVWIPSIYEPCKTRCCQRGWRYRTKPASQGLAKTTAKKHTKQTHHSLHTRSPKQQKHKDPLKRNTKNPTKRITTIYYISPSPSTIHLVIDVAVQISDLKGIVVGEGVAMEGVLKPLCSWSKSRKLCKISYVKSELKTL